MAKQNSFDEILNAPPASRNQVAEAIYDERYGLRGVKNAGELPSKRRRKKIALYRAIIGPGHESILEIGCGPGDLTYALVDHAQRVVGTDIAAKAIELARIRKTYGP